MTKFINGAIERPMLVLLAAIAIAVVCLTAYRNLPLREVPKIQVPYITVKTDYPGAAPGEVESLVTKPLERKINELEDIKVIISMSSRGHSYILVEFLSGSDVDEKVLQIRDKVSEAGDELPDALPVPSVERFSLLNRPVLFIFVYGDHDLHRLGEVAEGLRDKLETVRGCSYIDILGDLEREIQVQLDPDRLNAHLISIAEVAAALKQQNLDIPGGIVKTEDTGRLVRSLGRFRTVQDIGEVIVGFRFGTAIRIKDIANIEDTLEDTEVEFRVNGQKCVTMAVHINEKADLVDMVDMINEKLAQDKHTLPPGVRTEIAGDIGKVIRTMTDQLKLNALIGGVLVVLILMVGMGYRSSLMVSLAIPFSVLIACGIIYTLGMTLTGVAIFSLILALGLVVDGAIVVSENIYRHVEEGLSSAEAAKVGIHEVAGAVFCADLTTVVAFLPMMFMSGPIGQYISVIPKVVAGAVAGSLFVDHIVLPTVAARFMRARAERRRPRFSFHRHRFAVPHLKILSKALRHRWITIGIAILALAGSLMLIPVIGTELFPKTDTGKFWVTIQMPVGTTLQRTDEIARIVESRLGDIQDIDKYACSVGIMGLLDTTMGILTSKGENVVEFAVELIEANKRGRDVDEIIHHLRRRLSDIPDARIDIKQRVEGPPVGADVVVRIRGQDLTTLRAIAHDVGERLGTIEGAVDVQIDQEDNLPEIQVNIDRESASMLGLTSEAIASVIAVAVNGITVTTFREQDEEIDVRLRFPLWNRRETDDIRGLRILAPSGNLVPLSQVADIRETEGLAYIGRRDLKRTAIVKCNAAGRLVSRIVGDLKAELAELSLPQGYSIEYGGENEETEESFRSLGKAMIVAVVLVLIILVIQFKSLTQPIAIIMTVPLSFIGVILGLLVTDNPFGMMAFVGVVSLSGIVVNDAIVLVTYINTLRDRGLGKEAAIIQAAQVRLRPIMITTITTIVSLLPLTLGFGGLDFWAPLGWSIIWGLMTATLLTLVVVPVVYSLVTGAEGGESKQV